MIGMVKDDKSTLKSLTDTAKRTYEPCLLSFVLLGDDVIQASSPFNTKGTYDGVSDWNLFDGGMI